MRSTLCVNRRDHSRDHGGDGGDKHHKERQSRANAIRRKSEESR